MHDAHRWIDATEYLQERRVRHGVDVKIVQWIAHRGQVADLAGEVEDDVCIGDDVGHDSVADLRLDDLDVEPVDVAAIAAVTFDQGIDDAHGRAASDQFVGGVGPDEAQAAGDHADGGRQVIARGHLPMLEIPACKDRRHGRRRVPADGRRR